MVATISRGSAAITPRLILGYEATRASQHVFHDLWDTALPAVSLRPLGGRSGTLEMLFLDEISAAQAVAFHDANGVFTLTDPARPTIAMTYLPSGSVTRSLDTETGTRWVVRVDYREVSA
ncbi:hypothetical protein [Herbiconiux sp. VKM Ac-2851]|uniref:hypothetical protein n=1 Tax=Herbiconiux sp. VKM Ac-2851 TaxID=2739025 RepID=UPI001566DE90|nr:hypothetical protein [Herbiconiux sp. VKM Ac-2851]NQX34055.1 hypothetical protein [Herbiconiux sp. VKM Ac-2851]